MQVGRCTISDDSTSGSERASSSSPSTALREAVRYAGSSLTEAEKQVLIATDIGYIHPKTSAALVEQAVAIKRMLFRLEQNLRDQGPNSGSSNATPSTRYQVPGTGSGRSLS